MLRFLLLMTLAFGAGGAITLLWAPQVSDAVSALYPLAAESPYWRPDHGLLLYVQWPIVAVAAATSFLAPGALWSLRGGPRSVAEWLTGGLLASVVMAAVVVTVGKVVARPLTPMVNMGLWALFFGVGLVVAARRTKEMPRWSDHHRLPILVILWAGLSVLSVPMLFWSDFNSDGIEAFEFGRSLAWTWMPSFELDQGTFGFYHNFFAFAFPVQWFMQFFGAVEGASRFPFIVYVGATYLVVAVLTERSAPRRLGFGEEILLLWGVLLYAFVMGYASTYEPYHTDFGEPSATDALWIWAFMVAMWAWLDGRWALFFVAGTLNFTASTGGMLLLLLLAASIVFVWVINRPQGGFSLRFLPRDLIPVAALIVLAAIASILHELIYFKWILGAVKNQFGTSNMLARLIPPTFTSFERFSFLLIPTGFIPALCLLLIRPKRHPQLFVLALTAVGFFGVIYVQKWCGIHQFTPAMILPLPIFWSWYMQQGRSRWVAPTLAVGLAVGTYLSMPLHFQLSTYARQVGLAMDYRVGDYGRSLESASAASDMVYSVLRQDYRLLYPRQPWGGDPFAVVHYAHRPKPDGQPINYVVQSATEPAPEGFQRTAIQDGFALYVRDFDEWRRHRNPPMPRRFVSSVYDSPLRDSFAFFRQFAGLSLPEKVQTGTVGDVLPIEGATQE